MHNGSTITLDQMSSDKLKYFSSLRNSSTLPRNLSLNDSKKAYVTRRRSFIQKKRNLEITHIDGTTKIFTIDGDDLGQTLLDIICDELDLNEREYFGLKYTGKHNVDHWLNLDKRIAKQIKNNQGLEFQVRYYPPSMDWLEEDLTRYLLVLQIRQDILASKLISSPFVIAMLGAYTIQSELGDFNPEFHTSIDYLKNFKIAPKELQTQLFFETVQKLHKLHAGKSSEVANRCFIENARRMALYGNEVHAARDSQNQNVLLGVGSTGIIVHKNGLRVNRLSWPMIVRFCLDEKNVSIQYQNYDAIDFTKQTIEKKNLTFSEEKLNFTFDNQERALSMYNSFIDFHSFFRLRSLPSTQKKAKKPILISKLGGLSRTTSNVDNSMNQYWTLESQKKDSTKDASSSQNAFPFYSHSFLRQSFANLKTEHDDTASVVVKAPKSPKSLNASYNGSMSNLYGSPLLKVDPTTMIKNKLKLKLIEDKFRSRYELPNEKVHWNPSDCTPQVGFSQNQLDIRAMAGQGGQGVRATSGVCGPGAYYYETRVIEGNLVRIGWTTVDGSLNLGMDPFGFGYGHNINHNINNDRISYISSDSKSIEQGRGVQERDLIGCYLLLESDEKNPDKVISGKCFWTLNGALVNPKDTDAHLDVPEELLDQHFYPTCSLLDTRIVSLFFQKPAQDPLKRNIQWIPVGSAHPSKLHRENLRGWRLNPTDVSDEKSLLISADGRTVKVNRDAGWQGVRSNQGVMRSGKYQFEAKVLEVCTHVKVGWSTEDGSLLLGSDENGYGFGMDRDNFLKKNSKIYHNGKAENYSESFGKESIIGCYLNLDQGILHWSINGQSAGKAFNLDDEIIKNKTFFPTVSLENTTVEVNFGEKPFVHPSKIGWLPLLTAKGESICRSKKWTELIEKRQTDRGKVLSRIRQKVATTRPESFNLTATKKDEPVYAKIEKKEDIPKIKITGQDASKDPSTDTNK